MDKIAKSRAEQRKILEHDADPEEEGQDIRDVLRTWDEPDGATLDEIIVRYGGNEASKRTEKS